MLLTIPQPPKTNFGGRTTHDFPPRFIPLKTGSSPGPRVDSPVTTLRASITDIEMSTPHRGLPPPSAMTLPDPLRQPPPPASSMSHPQTLGPMPPQPSQWQGQEESMRQWLMAKSEEDKRKQEEEKTRQETLRLEQRRIEQSMLRESLQGGVPPQMVPMIYAGIGGANLAQVSIDWLHQYAAQLQAAQQQQQQIMQASPELRRETRMIGQPPGTSQPLQPGPPPAVPSQPVEQQQPQQPAPLQTTFSAYQPPGRPAPTSAPRSATHTSLPRLTTNEMHINQPPSNNPGSAHPLQQSQSISDQPASSPSIYFHHWVPPSESKDSKTNPGAPQTPASRGMGSGGSNAEPTSAHPGLDSGEYRDSPRKRKATGGHHANPPPSSANPIHPSPPFSTTSSTSGRRGGGHQRSRSNISTKEPESRPESRRDQEPPRTSSQHPELWPDERRAKPASRQDGGSFSGSEPARS